MEASVQITYPGGLHARPAVKIAQIAAKFDANVQLRVGEGGDWIKAKSTSKLMKLKARANTTLHFRADGEDASNAIDALVSFVRRNFDEEEISDLKIRTSLNDDSIESKTFSEKDKNLHADEETYLAKPVSTGLAFGEIYFVNLQKEFNREPFDSNEQELQLLKQAIHDVHNNLKELSKNTDKLGSDIIAFQISLLIDDEFLHPAFDHIEDGTAAHIAWKELLQSEIAEYEKSKDDVLIGRACDLRDLCDHVLSKLCDKPISNIEFPDHAILVTEELTPTQFLEIDWKYLAGAVVHKCGDNSHVALLARARGVPLVSHVTTVIEELVTGTPAILDAEEGKLILRPTVNIQKEYRQKFNRQKLDYEQTKKYLTQPAVTLKGKKVNVYINVDDPTLLENVDPEHCDGIGLARTEFQFYDKPTLPSEEEQYSTYCKIIEWAKGKIVTIRTLDAGGDKIIPGYSSTTENNPFLGLRGIRLSLQKPEILTVQIRALARAAASGPLRVMFPVVTTPKEFESVKNSFIQQVEKLQSENVDAKLPALGIMVEVPAAALTISEFNADFYSIGTNDLVQYVMAASRDCEEVAYLQQPLHPAVLELIQRVVDHGKKYKKEVSICGEMATHPNNIDALIKLGITSLSIPPVNLAKIKATIANI